MEHKDRLDQIKAIPDVGITLDDIVHNLKSQEASTINNDGVDSQLDYILSKSSLEWLEEAVKVS